MAAAVIESETVGVKSAGHSTSVPNDCHARLMYYLSCVNSCLPDLDAVPSQLRNYSNYYSLSEDNRFLVMLGAAVLKPEVLEGNVFFLVEDNSPVLEGM